jgi:nudix-type nucleoside diphosphatase (YffH/AdpP family)
LKADYKSIMPKILHEEIVFKDSLTLEKGQIQDDAGNTFSRVRVKRQDASCVLVLNTDSNKIVLTRQFRYGAAPKTNEHLLEVVAGKVDEGEEPFTTAIRETEEEIGYRVKKDNLTHLVTCFSSPAYTSERYHIYFASVSNADRKSKGGGLKNENESIELVEIKLAVFKEKILTGQFADAKTYVAGQHAMLKKFI